MRIYDAQGNADHGDILVKPDGVRWLIKANAVTDEKLRDSAALSVIGRASNTLGDPADIIAAADKSVLHRNGIALDFSPIDHTYISDFDAAVTALLPVGADPTAQVGLVAVPGVADTFMRSDAAPPLNQGISPTWTAQHRWADNAEAQWGDGGDLRIFHDGTDSQIINSTGVLRFRLASPNQDALFHSTPAINAALVNEKPNVVVERSIKVVRTNAPNMGGYCFGSTGSLAVPAAASNGNTLFSLRGIGFVNATTGSLGCSIEFEAADDWNPASSPARIDFYTCGAGSLATSLALRITSERGIGLIDGIAEPSTLSGFAQLYVDAADGDLKVKFGDGTVRTITTD